MGFMGKRQQNHAGGIGMETHLAGWRDEDQNGWRDAGLQEPILDPQLYLSSLKAKNNKYSP